MGLRTVDLLTALADRPNSTQQELAMRLHRNQADVGRMLGQLRRAGCARHRDSKWALSKQGAALLAVFQRRQDRRATYALMMRDNTPAIH